MRGRGARRPRQRASLNHMTEDREQLWQAHCARMREHWGDKFDLSRTAWPQTEADWRRTPHGAPWDSNVEVARFTVRLFHRLVPVLISPENCPSHPPREDVT